MLQLYGDIKIYKGPRTLSEYMIDQNLKAD